VSHRRNVYIAYPLKRVREVIVKRRGKMLHFVFLLTAVLLTWLPKGKAKLWSIPFWFGLVILILGSV